MRVYGIANAWSTFHSFNSKTDALSLLTITQLKYTLNIVATSMNTFSPIVRNTYTRVNYCTSNRIMYRGRGGGAKQAWHHISKEHTSGAKKKLSQKMRVYGIAYAWSIWLNGVPNRFRTLIRVGASALLWSLWLCRNDFVFNNKNPTPLQVIFRCTHFLHTWSTIHRVEYQSLSRRCVYAIGADGQGGFTQHAWQHNLRIGPPSPAT